MKTVPANFLEQSLIEQVKLAPARWDMIVTIGIAGDVEENPTVAWAAEREQVKVGTLTITGASPQKGRTVRKLIMTPWS